MIEHCQNPWNQRCSRKDIVLHIKYKGKSRAICANCWAKLTKEAKEWNRDDIRPPYKANVIADDVGMVINGKLRVEDEENRKLMYTWRERIRRCSKCKIVKPVNQFYIKKNGIVNAWCKDCCREYFKSKGISIENRREV